MPTRRDFCRATASTAKVGVPSALVLGAAGVVAADHFDARPAHVTISYDQDELETYRPHLTFQGNERQNLIGLYGWTATSPEHGTDVHCYWCSYYHQDGWLGNLDSHEGDHEPIQVEVDSETGDVVRVRASVYHWMKGEQRAETVPMDGKHVRLEVVSPWHQYTAADPSDSVYKLDVKDLTAVFQSWLDNGLESALLPGSTTNPWIMESEDSWWRGTAGAQFDAAMVKAARGVGIGEEGSLST